MFGRLLGGIATSLLFSAFESWIVAEHFSKGLDEKWLGDTFSKAVFVGNGLVAILSGLLANFLVDNMKLGPVAPFDASATVLLFGGAIILSSWGERIKAGTRSRQCGHFSPLMPPLMMMNCYMRYMDTLNSSGLIVTRRELRGFEARPRTCPPIQERRSCHHRR